MPLTTASGLLVDLRKYFAGIDLQATFLITLFAITDEPEATGRNKS